MSFSPTGDRFAAFRHSSYTRFFFARFLLSFSQQIVSVAVGWQMYDQTGSAIYLGLIGLVQFLPSLVLILVTGSVADRHNRRAIAAICSLVSALCTLALLLMTITGTFSPLPVFTVLLVFGIERAFMSPAVQSLAPNLVPPEDLSNAIAWNSSSWQLAAITGPVLGGLLYGVSPHTAYTVAVIFAALGAALLYMIPKPPQKTTGEAKSWDMILGGFRFIRAEKVVLGAISLDLFAVLLGGATALMPIFARDILTLGPWGLGLLRSAPGVGAIAMAIFLAAYPLRHSAGVAMFVGVALFGIGTVVFGFSTSTELSIAALAIMGAADDDFRLCAGEPDRTLDAGRTARSGQCRQHGLRGRLERTRRISSGHDGFHFWRRPCGYHRRCWHACRGGDLGNELSEAPQDRHA